MFEKAAEEYLKKDGTKAEQILDMLNEISLLKITLNQVPFILAMIQQVFKDGAEFGYNKAFVEADKNLKAIVTDFNKANEWHFVKDGDLPNTETKNYTYIRRRKRYERQFTNYRVIKCFVLCLNEKGKTTAEVGYFDCSQKCFLDKAEGMVIAWKEIVPPKEGE